MPDNRVSLGGGFRSSRSSGIVLLAGCAMTRIFASLETYGQGTLSHLTMVMYTKLGLTLSTAEGNDTAIALCHSTDPLKLTVRALTVWLGS